MLNRGNRLNFFTLAEVLLVLGIIGVVAAMTIPSLISNNQKSQYLTSLKKAYTVFNQALTQVAADMGCVGDLQCTNLFSGDSQSVGTELVKYFNVVKNCGTTKTGCMPNKIYGLFDGSSSLPNWIPASYSFVTTDGMAYSIISIANNCTWGTPGYLNTYMTQYCGYVTVDVNGLKPPNTYGRDVFNFVITNGKGPSLYPSGGADDGDNGWWKDGPTCDSSTNDGGASCAARIIEENWQMNY